MHGGVPQPSPTWDVFISHASEDKDLVARPLAEELQKRGYRVWYDEFRLVMGDSLRRSVDFGLAHSRYGVVVLSPSFFAKEWPLRELDGLTSREIVGGKVVLPVWHGVSHADVARHSPVLADRLASSSERGITALADAVEKAIGAPQLEFYPNVTPAPMRGLGEHLTQTRHDIVGYEQLTTGERALVLDRIVTSYEEESENLDDLLDDAAALEQLQMIEPDPSLLDRVRKARSRVEESIRGEIAHLEQTNPSW